MTDASYIDRPNRPLHYYALCYLAFLYIPVLFLPWFSFNDSIYIAFPLKEFTTKWYVELFQNEPMFAALMNSIKVGAATSVIATLLGILAAKAVTRYRMPGRAPLVGFIMPIASAAPMGQSFTLATTSRRRCSAARTGSCSAT